MKAEQDRLTIDSFLRDPTRSTKVPRNPPPKEDCTSRLTQVHGVQRKKGASDDVFAALTTAGDNEKYGFSSLQDRLLGLS